jgi:hypothetical protein
VLFLAHALMYFVSVGAILVLLASTLALLIWMLVKLRRAAIRLLGGTIRE